MINAKMVWTIDPVAAARRLTQSMNNRAMRIALNAGSAPVKEAVIASAPSDTGNYKKAVRIKVKNYNGGSTWVSIIGASSSFKRAKKTKDKKTGRSKIKKSKTGGKVYSMPARYQWPVDRGHKGARGRNFISTAFQRAKRQFDVVAQQKLREVIEQLTAAK